MTRLLLCSTSIFVQAIAFSFGAAAQERVDHAGAGIGLNRPAAWHEATLAHVQANRDRVRLSDPELQQAFRTRSNPWRPPQKRTSSST